MERHRPQTDRQSHNRQTSLTQKQAHPKQQADIGTHRKKRIDKETGQTDSHDRLQTGTDSDTTDRQNRRYSEHKVENLNLDSSWLNNSTGKGKCFYFFLSLIGHQCIIADLELITKAL